MLAELADITDIDDVIDWLLSDGIRIGGILVGAIVAYILLRLTTHRVVRVLVKQRQGRRPLGERQKREETLSSVFISSGAIFIIFLTLFMVLAQLDINVTPLLAGFGVAGIAVGLGAQSLIRDVLRGIFIIVDDQYRKGDVVNIAGKAGLVENVGLRRTVLRDLDGIVHFVPNGEITVASNYTREWSRVNLNIPVAYKENLDRVIEVLNKVGKELAEDEFWGPFIDEAPKVLRVDSFDDSGIAVKMLGVTKPIKQWDVMGELRKRIKRAFDEEGIEIPYPHRTIYWGVGAHPMQASPDRQREKRAEEKLAKGDSSPSDEEEGQDVDTLEEEEKQ